MREVAPRMNVRIDCARSMSWSCHFRQGSPPGDRTSVIGKDAIGEDEAPLFVYLLLLDAKKL
jgi:hypothetical protein